MLVLLLSIGLFGQVLVTPVQAYTTADAQLATVDGRYALMFGFNCDGIGLGQNVEFWRLESFPNQGVLAPLDAFGRVATASVVDGNVQSELCSVAIEPISAVPCVTNLDGLCDVTGELAALSGP
jgi:hypothetical protein